MPPSSSAPRLSPDGSRVAYVFNNATTGRIATIGFDGTAGRELSNFESTGGVEALAANIPGYYDRNDAIADNYPSAIPVHPRWKDATHIGWISFVGPTARPPHVALSWPRRQTEWELYVAEDREGAKPELVMHCSSSSVTNFDFAADGSIIAATNHTIEGGKMPMNLLVYRPNATTKECEVVRNFTNNVESNSIAREFALSPDKSTIAFFSGTELVPQNFSLNIDPRQERLAVELFTVPFHLDQRQGR